MPQVPDQAGTVGDGAQELWPKGTRGGLSGPGGRLCRDPGRLFLPGGGIEPGETPEECLRRECLEELGREIVLGEPLCTGEEYLFAPSDGRYLHVMGRCYRAALGPQVREPVEHDHALRWVPAESCEHALFLEYQAWAIRLAWEERMQEK